MIQVGIKNGRVKSQIMLEVMQENLQGKTTRKRKKQMFEPKK
jgi:hypothetical protein